MKNIFSSAIIISFIILPFLVFAQADIRSKPGDQTNEMSATEGAKYIFQNNESNLDFLKRAYGDKEKIVVRPASGPVIVGNDLPVLTATISLETINNIDDFENFAKNIAAQDSNIKLIKLTPDSIEVDYQYPGKLFGIIPVTALAKSIIDNEHRVKIKFPWYGIFITKPIEFKLQDSTSDLSKLQILELQNELQKQAWSLQLLSSIMKAKHDSAMNSIRNMK